MKIIKTNAYVLVFGALAALIVIAALSTLIFNSNTPANGSSVALHDLGPAPNIQGISAWINSPALNISQLRGKVVLVDFWTYSCINCIRTIPYLNAWEKEYGNDGLVIIGVSTPEFQFEHNLSNVESAVQRFNITYPVALDNNYSTWDAYGNEYWPADYIINKSGDIVYTSIGEGNYNTTQMVIEELLEGAGYSANTSMADVKSTVNFSGIDTPEIYLGWARAREALGNAQGFEPNTTVNYTITNITQENVAYLSGEWYNAPDGMVAVNNSVIVLVYKAKNVNIVASSTTNSSAITVGIDGHNLNSSYIGTDLHFDNGTAQGMVNQSRLYNIISGPSYNGWHVVEIRAAKGFKIYTFTFG